MGHGIPYPTCLEIAYSMASMKDHLAQKQLQTSGHKVKLYTLHGDGMKTL